MSRRKLIILCVICLLAGGGILQILCGPPLWVQEGMTYEDVEAVLGKQYHGLRPVSLVDGSWTGLWPGLWGVIEVKFDRDNRVRQPPNMLHCLLSRLFCIKQ